MSRNADDEAAAAAGTPTPGPSLAGGSKTRQALLARCSPV